MVTDFTYHGNHLDVQHLSKGQNSALSGRQTPNISQLSFATGLRHYQSLNTSIDEEQPSSRNSSKLKDFVTVFKKQPRMQQISSSEFMPTFLPPMRNASKE
jgi:hypothetical protein